jgi:hypothetical protein
MMKPGISCIQISELKTKTEIAPEKDRDRFVALALPG